MNADERRDALNQISEKIIGCAYNISNSLGCGFLEKVYENALVVELRSNGLKAVQQQPIKVKYKQAVVGEYIADIVVEDQVIIETKACRALDDIHSAQCMNYLRATNMRLCLLLNFGTPAIQIKRIVLNF